ncbi:MAG: phage tail protein [Candidatus Onthovivens sp.]|nr:phage tail protein [Candidatus Onthovivens sp.]
MLQLYDIKHNKIELLTQCKDAYIENEISDGLLDKNLSFSYPLTDSKSQLIKFDGFIRTKDDEFVIKEISFSDNSKEVKCKLNVEELEEKKHSSFNLSGNINKILDTLLNGIVWTYEIKQVPSITNAVFQVDSETTAFDLCKSITEQFEVEFKFDTINKKILVYNKIGVDSGQIITSDIQVQGDTYDLITEINATGANGITCKVTNHSYSPRIKSLNWTDERYTSIETLRNAAQTKLDKLCKPLFSYSCSTLRCKSISVGDYVNILDKKSGTKVKERAVKTKEYIRESEKYKNEFEIDNAKPTFQDYLNSKFNSYDSNFNSYDSKFNSYDSKYNSKFNNYDNKITNLDTRVTNLESATGNGELNEYVIDLKLLDRTTVNVTAGRVIKFNIDWGDGTVDSNIQHTYTLKEGDNTQFTLKTKDILGQDLRKCCIAINKLLFVPLYDNDDPDAFDEDTENLFKGFINLKHVGDITGRIKDLTGMFIGCVKLEHPGNLTEGAEITDRMYEGCTSLKECCKLPSTVKSAVSMYYRCSSLEVAGELNEGLTDASFMYSASGVVKMDNPLPSTLKNIDSMFYCCKLKEIDWKIFDNVTIDSAKNTFTGCNKLVSIKGEINHIKDGTGLLSSCGFTVMPKFAADNILEIADSMFGTGTGEYKKLESYGGNTLPNSVKSMKYCFANTDITEVLPVPSGITDKNAFKGCYRNCTKLTDVSNMIDFISSHTDTNDNSCFTDSLAITTPATAKELNEQYSGWSFNHVTVPY